MRLLNVATRRFETFADDFDEMPAYAILSHTWLQPNEKEVSYHDIFWQQPYEDKDGYPKVDFTCKRAIADKLKYVWIDTCCIDKSSTADLARSINSMFRYYTHSAKCYVHLADVTFDPTDSSAWRTQFEKSRWFTRGWTLQELLAPVTVDFFAATQDLLGTRHELASAISQITGIAEKALRDSRYSRREVVQDFTVSQRFAWGAKRTTSEPEDIAYCLVGLFDVYLDPNYSEGAEKAFKRLQIEIMSQDSDESILAWKGDAPGLFAPSLSSFADSASIIKPSDLQKVMPYMDVSRTGLRIRAHLLKVSDLPRDATVPFLATHFMPLRCEYDGGHYTPCLFLVKFKADDRELEFEWEKRLYPAHGAHRLFNILNSHLKRRTVRERIFIEAGPPLIPSGVQVVLMSSGTQRKMQIEERVPGHYGCLRPISGPKSGGIYVWSHSKELESCIVSGVRLRLHESRSSIDVVFESDREKQCMRLIDLRPAGRDYSLAEFCKNVQSTVADVTSPWVPWSGIQTQTEQAWHGVNKFGPRAISLRCGSSCTVKACDESGWLVVEHMDKE